MWVSILTMMRKSRLQIAAIRESPKRQGATPRTATYDMFHTKIIRGLLYYSMYASVFTFLTRVYRDCQA